MYHQDRYLWQITAPLADISISYAELYAIYAFLYHLSLDPSFKGNIQIPDQEAQNEQIPVHFFTDSMYSTHRTYYAQQTTQKIIFTLSKKLKTMLKNSHTLSLQYTGFLHISKTLSLEDYQLKGT